MGYPNSSFLLLLRYRGINTLLWILHEIKRNYSYKGFIGGDILTKNGEGAGGAWENHEFAMIFDPCERRGGEGRKESHRLQYSSKNVWTNLKKGVVESVSHFISPVSPSNETALISLILGLVIGWEQPLKSMALI